MADTWGFKWDDVGMRKALSRFDKDVDWATRNGLRSAAAAIGKVERKLAPKATGALRKSVRAGKVTRDTSMGVSRSAYKVYVGPMRAGGGVSVWRYRSIMASRTGFVTEGYAAGGPIAEEKCKAAYLKTWQKLGH